jgi:hypothetical protein
MRWRVEPLLLLALALNAQAGAPMRVTSAEQAQRDAARLQILEQERRAEEQALQAAAQRRNERSAAGDAQGAIEAAQAERTHSRNLDALRIELGTARAAPSATTAKSGTRPPRGVAQRREARWWDVYTPAQPTAQAPGRGWSAYTRGATP